MNYELRSTPKFESLFKKLPSTEDDYREDISIVIEEKLFTAD